MEEDPGWASPAVASGAPCGHGLVVRRRPDEDGVCDWGAWKVPHQPFATRTPDGIAKVIPMRSNQENALPLPGAA